MRVAIVYDYLNQLGGGERVLEVVGEMFPHSPIYSIFYDQERTQGRFAGRKIYTSFLDFPLARRHHHWFIGLMPLAAWSLNLDDQYDLIISIGAGYAKGIRYKKPTKHLHYCLSPLRYAWEMEYLAMKLQIPNSKLQINYKFQFLKLISYFHRWWDYRAAQKPDLILADSKFIAGKIKKYYGREAEVLYPSAPLKYLYDRKVTLVEDYFLAVGRLLDYKRFDLVIEAFNQLGWSLKIVGIGPDYRRLRQLARSPQIEFLGFVPDEKLSQLYAGARALIFPQAEDYGLVAMEAITCGCPVIAYAAGGALETVQEGKTGMFFQEQSASAIVAALWKFSARGRSAFGEKDLKPLPLHDFKDKLQSHILSLINGNRN